jgi:hypothetical protein
MPLVADVIEPSDVHAIACRAATRALARRAAVVQIGSFHRDPVGGSDGGVR